LHLRPHLVLQKPSSWEDRGKPRTLLAEGLRVILSVWSILSLYLLWMAGSSILDDGPWTLELVGAALGLSLAVLIGILDLRWSRPHAASLLAVAAYMAGWLAVLPAVEELCLGCVRPQVWQPRVLPASVFVGLPVLLVLALVLVPAVSTYRPWAWPTLLLSSLLHPTGVLAFLPIAWLLFLFLGLAYREFFPRPSIRRPRMMEGIR